MSLLQPAMLWLLGAMLVPVFIHLYNRRRAVRRQLPTLVFLQRSQRRLARRMKIRQWLLLALRIGVFAVLPLAFAKPYLLSEQGQTADENLPTAAVFVVDDALTMQARVDGDSTSFDLARAATLDALSELDAWDEAALIFSTRPQRPAVPHLSDDVGEVRAALEERQPGFARADLQRSLEVARDMLADSELPTRKIVVVTDLSRANWPTALVEGLVGGIAHVQVIDVADPGPNLAIVDASFQADQSGLARAFEVRAVLRSYASEEAMEATVALVVSHEDVATTQVRVEPHEDAAVSFHHRLETDGLQPVSVEIREGDDVLRADNQRHLVLGATQNMRVLLVNGDPRTLPYQDELYYLERALRPHVDSASAMLPRITTPQGLDNERLEEIDVVVLANVAALKSGQVERLTRFVRQGGGLLMTMGSQVDPTLANRSLGELLPSQLRSLKRLAHSDDAGAALTATRFDRLDYNHAVLRPFARPGGEGLQTAMVYAYMLVEPSPEAEARTIARYADGGPALIEKTFGAGRILLLTTTIDRDWSTLAINKAFLPMMRRMASYLARSPSDDPGHAATVGARFQLPLDGYALERLTVLTPSGARLVLGPQELAEPRVSVPIDEPGYYAVETEQQGVTLWSDGLGFAANLEPEASDTREMATSELSTLWESNEQDGDQAAAGDAQSKRLPLWPVLLMTALLFLYVETMVGLRRSFLQAIRQKLRWGGQETTATSVE